MKEAEDEFMTFLDNLFNMYSDFPGKEFFLTGESYSGKYIPAFANKILETNAAAGNNRYNLKASLIGDPYAAPMH